MISQLQIIVCVCIFCFHISIKIFKNFSFMIYIKFYNIWYFESRLTFLFEYNYVIMVIIVLDGRIM